MTKKSVIHIKLPDIVKVAVARDVHYASFLLCRIKLKYIQEYNLVQLYYPDTQDKIDELKQGAFRTITDLYSIEQAKKRGRRPRYTEIPKEFYYPEVCCILTGDRVKDCQELAELKSALSPDGFVLILADNELDKGKLEGICCTSQQVIMKYDGDAGLLECINTFAQPS